MYLFNFNYFRKNLENVNIKCDNTKFIFYNIKKIQINYFHKLFHFIFFYLMQIIIFLKLNNSLRLNLN